MSQDTITKIDNLLRGVTQVALDACSSMEALSEFAQRPGVRKYLSPRQLSVLTSLTFLAIDVHIVTNDLRIVWNDVKGNRP